MVQQEPPPPPPLVAYKDPVIHRDSDGGIADQDVTQPNQTLIDCIVAIKRTFQQCGSCMIA